MWVSMLEVFLQLSVCISACCPLIYTLSMYSIYLTNRDDDVIVECRSDTIQCGGRCAFISQICDGVTHCPNGEDERNCCKYWFSHSNVNVNDLLIVMVTLLCFLLLSSLRLPILHSIVYTDLKVASTLSSSCLPPVFGFLGHKVEKMSSFVIWYSFSKRGQNNVLYCIGYTIPKLKPIL